MNCLRANMITPSIKPPFSLDLKDNKHQRIALINLHSDIAYALTQVFSYISFNTDLKCDNLFKANKELPDEQEPIIEVVKHLQNAVEIIENEITKKAKEDL